MGGNVTVNGYQASPLVLNSPEDRSAISLGVHHLLSRLMKNLYSITNIPIRINDSWYTGSSKHLMNYMLSDDEFFQFKKQVGDIDVQFPIKYRSILEENIMDLADHIVGYKKHGNEISLVYNDRYESIFQIDFQFVENPGSVEDSFLHSSNWLDIKNGFCGAHHKILLNAIAGEHMKFSITHGLRFREESEFYDNHKDFQVKDPSRICISLFPGVSYTSNHDMNNILSFTNLPSSINQYFNKEQKKKIFDKFVSSVEKLNIDSEQAITFLKKALNV